MNRRHIYTELYLLNHFEYHRHHVAFMVSLTKAVSRNVSPDVNFLRNKAGVVRNRIDGTHVLKIYAH